MDPNFRTEFSRLHDLLPTNMHRKRTGRDAIRHILVAGSLENAHFSSHSEQKLTSRTKKSLLFSSSSCSSISLCVSVAHVCIDVWRRGKNKGFSNRNGFFFIRAIHILLSQSSLV